MKLSFILFVFGIVSTASTTTVSPDCGGTLQASSSAKDLESPGYPVAYQSNTNCTWLIQASPASAMIRVIVVDSHLEYEMECKYDSVKVYNGPSTHSRHINTWCGTMTPTVQSSGSSLTLRFTTNSNRTYKGFKLKYFATTERYHCGTNLTATTESATLLLPGYPHMYQNDARCAWIIVATPGKTIQVVFTDSNIESSTFCKYDWARVLDGNSFRSPQLGRFCGFTTPNYTSSGNSMLVEFHSDAERVYKGFKMKYSAGIFQMCSDQNVVARAATNYITSLGYPDYYQGPSQKDCTWLIDTGNDNYVVSVKVESAAINCTDSYLEVYDGSTDSSTSLGTWCGNSQTSKLSTGRYMFLKYHTTSVAPKARFRINYTAKSNSSSFTTMSTMGTILTILCSVVLIPSDWHYL